MPAVLLEKFIHIDIWKKDGNRRCDVTSKELASVLNPPSWEKRQENMLFYGLIKVIRLNFCHKILDKICKTYFLKMYKLKDTDEEAKKALNIFTGKNNNTNGIYILIDKLKTHDLKIAGFSGNEDCDKLKFKIYI